MGEMGKPVEKRSGKKTGDSVLQTTETHREAGPVKTIGTGPVMTATDELKKLLALLRKTWALSMGIIISLVVGIALGIVYKQGDIIDDCKYAGSFRVHSQAFNCQRKI